ncbi:MAG: hypothetical protein K6G52_00835 [Treponemataceae bacterium]|nr:hypothetical protein [Treponemataceae bacterium]
MKKIHLCFLLLILTFSTGLVYANTLNILINQVDNGGIVPEFEAENVQVFLDSFMEYMFDAGFIVSSEKISLAPDITSDEGLAIHACRHGYFDYLAVIRLKFNPDTNQIMNAEWQVKEIASLLVKNHGHEYPNEKTTNPEGDAKKFGVQVARKIYSSVNDVMDW